MPNTNLVNTDYFANRNLELDQLFECLGRVQNGKPTIVLVEGEVGSGKTYLVNEFLQRVEQGHPDIIIGTGTCSQLGELTEPLLPFREILLSLASQAKQRPQGENLVGIKNFLDQVAPDWLEAVPVVGQILKAAYVTASVMYKKGKPVNDQKLHNQFENALLKLTESKRLAIIFVDDFHWADQSSAALLLHLAQNAQAGKMLGHTPFMILVTYRSDELHLQNTHREYDLSRIANEVKRYGGVVISLDYSLQHNRSSVEHLVLEFLRQRYGLYEVSPAFVNWLIDRTTGNCLMLDLLLSDLERTGGVYNDSGIWRVRTEYARHDVQRDLTSLFQQRLLSVDNNPHALDLLRAASVQGKRFSLQVVARALNTDVAALIDTVEILSRAKLIQPHNKSDILSSEYLEYNYRHDLMREYVYQNISTPQKQLLHRKMGVAVEEVGYPTPAGEQARNFHIGGISNKAIEYYLIAAEQLLRIEAYPQLERIANDALLATPKIETLEKQFDSECKLLWYLSYVWDASGEWMFAIEKLEATYTKYERQGYANIAFPLAHRLGGLYMRGGRNYKLAEKWLRKSLAAIRPGENETLALAALSGLTNVLKATRRLDTAIKIAEPYAARYTDWRGLDASLLFQLAILWYRLGWAYERKSGFDQTRPEFDKAMAYYTQSVAIGRELNAPHLIGRGLPVMAYLTALKGDLEAAEKQAHEAVTLFSDETNPRLKSLAIRQLGAVQLEAGRFRHALKNLETALTIQRQIDDKPGIAHTLVFLAEWRRRVGDLLGCQRAIDEAWQLMNETKAFGLKVLIDFLGLTANVSTTDGEA